MYSVDLVTFDIAGTTMQDKNMVENAFMAAFEEHEIGATYDELIPYRGTAKRPIMEAMVATHRPDAGAELVDAAMSSFDVAIDEEIRANAEAIPGAEEIFRWLRERGIKTGITTGFGRHVRDLVLATLGWNQGMLDAVTCSEEVTRSRPAPQMIFRLMEATGVTDVRRVMVVGDTPNDLASGVNAGCGGIVGVVTGSHDWASLGRHRHTHLIGSVAELPELMEAEFRG